MAKLAINGDIPVRTESFPSRIMFNEEEKKAVAKLMEKASIYLNYLSLYKFPKP